MGKKLAGACASLAVVVTILGAWPANAVNEYAGQPYGKAAEQVAKYGGTPVVADRVGSYLPTEKCMVTGSRRGRPGDPRGNVILLDLNCNDVSAQNGHPGNSAASPEGKKAKALRDWGANINKDFAKAIEAGKESESWCATHLSNCKYACEVSSACSAEVLDFLGV